MSKIPKLFMVLLGCRPKGRLTEQHDIFFGIASELKDLIREMNQFWPDSNGLHIDAWREVTQVNEFKITVTPNYDVDKSNQNLFFINLGGYKANDFEEYHYKILSVAPDLAEATKSAKQNTFFKHANLNGPGGVSHIDDKYGIDLDEIYKVKDLLSADLKEKYRISIRPSTGFSEDKLHIGYLKLSNLK